MKYRNSVPLTSEFFENLLGSWEPENRRHPNLIEEILSGMIILEKPSCHKMHEELLTEASQRTFYRDVHNLASQMSRYFKDIITTLQQSSPLQMHGNGLISIDEHIISHSSKTMEGVGKFYSPTDQEYVTGHSVIFAHYFRRNTEYPVWFEFYWKEAELLERGQAIDFEKKNAITRGIMRELAAMPTCPTCPEAAFLYQYLFNPQNSREIPFERCENKEFN